MLTIELCNVKDLDGVIHVNQVAIPEHYTFEFFLKTLSSFPNFFYVAKNNNEVVGYIMCTLEEYPLVTGELTTGAPEMCGVVISVAVLEEWRRQKLGTLLLKTAITAMYRSGVRYVVLQVRKSNTPAQRLYKKFGFVNMSTLPMYYADGEDAYLMCCRLR
jgi:ribosomal-protein-alanine N-acetyltransferase